MKSKFKPKIVPVVQAEEEKIPHLLDPDFRWTRGADVQKTWRKYGWVPPSETKFKHIYTEEQPKGNT